MKIPTHDEAMAAVEETGNATALDILVYEEQPADFCGGDVWRQRLQAVLDQAGLDEDDLDLLRDAAAILADRGYDSTAGELSALHHRLKGTP